MNPHLYNTLLFLHILLTVIWVGGGITIQWLALRVLRRGPEAIADFSSDIAWAGMRVFMPASGLLFLVGVPMVAWGPWDFTQTWVLIGIAGFLLTFITGAALLGPTSKKLSELIKTNGVEDPGVAPLVKKLLTISRVDMIVLVIVIWDMAFKPGL